MCKSSDNRRRIQIGLLISHLDEDFDDSVCEGAMIGAEQADVNLVIFPGRYIDGVYADKLRTEFEYQYNTLFDIPTFNKFDVLLVLIGTIGSHLDKAHKSEFLKKFGDTPVITITSEIEGYPCITIDNRTGMEQTISHLIKVHGCKKIGFVSGPKTSDDAIERLAVYRKTIEEAGIEYDEGRVVYGNFSKYSTAEVRDLLDRNRDLEAIAFANDQMAVAGYQVLEERGLRPGKDIYVTGFDDDPAAQNLTPHLTTVKADPTELGYSAVLEAVNYLNNGTLRNESIPSSMVCRNSCGCLGNPGLNSVVFEEIGDNAEEFAAVISDFLFDRYRASDSTTNMRKRFAKLIMAIDEFCTGGCRSKPLSLEIADTVYKMTDEKFFTFVNADNLYAVIEHIHKLYNKKLDDPESYHALNSLFIRIYKVIAERNASYCKSQLDDNYFMTWQTNSITRDMLVFESYDDESYFSVIDKLTRLHMNSGYLFSYEPAIVHKKNDVWKPPENIYLKAYHDGSSAVSLPTEKQHIAPDELFTNPYLPKNRRYSMVVSPLFSNEEHYGILLCEIDHEYFHYIQSVTVQLCAALKIITLMKQQAKTQRQLQKSLIEIKENNQLLSDLSRQDDLTGCYNRRGFFEAVRKKLSDDDYSGTEAIMVFADLDSLKTINDRFGHEEGDFAIRSAAQILQHAFGDDEIVGRIGGDEFVVCAFLNSAVDIPALREHIETLTRIYNENYASEKPYIIHTSVGVYPFRCTDTVEIGELLSHADTLLYEQKKHKKSILKSDGEEGKALNS